MVPLLPLRDGVRALPISFFRQSMPSFYMNAPDCICSPGRLPLGAFCTGRDGRYEQDWPTRCAFQSTHPVRGATRPRRSPSFLPLTFQSTHPVRGATLACLAAHLAQAGFQSTHPVRGATGSRHKKRLYVRISIHAPRAGCDPHASSIASLSVSFQSTHPVWGATGSAGST